MFVQKWVNTTVVSDIGEVITKPFDKCSTRELIQIEFRLD